MTQLHATFGDALAKAHRSLLEDLQGLEAPAATKEQPTGLAARLDQTRAHLAEHFRFEEENGYLSAVLERQPYLDRVVHHLAEEHRELLQMLDELRAEARSIATASEALQQKMVQWIHKVRRHEQSENALVEDAFNLDMSAED